MKLQEASGAATSNTTDNGDGGLRAANVLRGTSEILSDEDKKRFHRLQISISDLADAVGYLDVIIAKAWHHPPWYGRGVTYKYQAAFTTAAIVSYCRPFTRSNGLPAFPPDLVKYSGEESKLHEKILKLRNQVTLTLMRQ